jgi:hypothetical protein
MTNPPNMLQSRAIRSREFENIMVFAGIKRWAQEPVRRVAKTLAKTKTIGDKKT